MPKEIVWGNTPREEHDGDNIFVPVVLWQRDRDVTVGLVPIGTPEAPGKGLYSDVMTRTQINNLIRVLRRARDQAYGRDE